MEEENSNVLYPAVFFCKLLGTYQNNSKTFASIIRRLVISFGISFIPGVCVINVVYSAITTEKYLNSDLFETIVILFSCIGQLYAILYFTIHKKTFADIPDIVSNFSKFGVPPDIPEKMRLQKNICKFILAYTCCGSFGFTSIGLLQESECLKLSELHGVRRTCGLFVPILFELKLTITYKFIITFLTLVSVLSITNSAIFLLLFISMSSEMVLSRLLHFKSMLQELSEINSEEKLISRFNFCIDYHRDILRIASEINSKYRNVIVAYLFIASYIISVVGYQLMRDKTYIPLLHFLGWVGCMFILCYVGQRLLNVSSTLPYTIYDIHWYKAEYRTVRHNLRFMLMRSQTQIGIAAGGFKNVSYEVFAEMMYGAYSLLAVIRDENGN